MKALLSRERLWGLIGVAQQPVLQDLDGVTDLLVRQRAVFGDSVPFGQATAAAGGRGVLGDEDRMTPHGGLPAVVAGRGRGQPIDDELPAVIQNHRQRLLLEIGPLLGSQSKTAAELASAKGREKVVEVAHGLSPRPLAASSKVPLSPLGRGVRGCG